MRLTLRKPGSFFFSTLGMAVGLGALLAEAAFAKALALQVETTHMIQERQWIPVLGLSVPHPLVSF